MVRLVFKTTTDSLNKQTRHLIIRSSREAANPLKLVATHKIPLKGWEQWKAALSMTFHFHSRTSQASSTAVLDSS